MYSFHRASPAVSRERFLSDMVDFSLEAPPGQIPDCDREDLDDHLCSPSYCDGIMDHLRKVEVILMSLFGFYCFFNSLVVVLLKNTRNALQRSHTRT
jgi:hypothetical protein